MINDDANTPEDIDFYTKTQEIMKCYGSRYKRSKKLLEKGTRIANQNASRSHRLLKKACVLAEKESMAVKKYEEAMMILTKQNRHQNKKIIRLGDQYRKAMAKGNIRKMSRISERLLRIATSQKIPEGISITFFKNDQMIYLIINNESKYTIAIDEVSCNSPMVKVSCVFPMVRYINAGDQMELPIEIDQLMYDVVKIETFIKYTYQLRTYSRTESHVITLT